MILRPAIFSSTCRARSRTSNEATRRTAIFRLRFVPRERNRDEEMKDAGRNSDPLDAILRRAMRERPAAETPECADPESIAAYWDKSLAGPDRERLEVHLADCMRCQMLLAAIARADQQASDAGAAVQVRWYQGMRIAIPALAAVAAVAVFVAMRRPTSEQSQHEVVAMAKPQAPLTPVP